MNDNQNEISKWDSIWMEYFNPETMKQDLNIKEYVWGQGLGVLNGWYKYRTFDTYCKDIAFVWKNEEQMREALSILKAQELEFFKKQYDEPINVLVQMWEDEYTINGQTFKLK
ncbi:MAG: hypothetical protein ACRCXN_08390 [Bacteroidales bacterium]